MLLRRPTTGPRRRPSSPRPRSRVRSVGPSLAVLAAVWLGRAGPARAAPPPDVLLRPSNEPVYSVGAEFRVPVLLGGGAAVVSPPVGFGATFVFRYHGVPLGVARLGGLLAVGHDRVLDRRTIVYADETGTERRAVRWAAHDQTTFLTGPTVQLPLRRVFLEVGAGVGLAVGNLLRPVPGDPTRETRAFGVGFAVRGDATLGIPFASGHGLLVGLTFTKVFSNVRTTEDPALADDPSAPQDTAPFDMTLAPFVGYQGWF